MNATARITKLAQAAGLTITEHAPYAGTFELEITRTLTCNCPECVAENTAFGAVVFGRRTGKVLRGHLTFGGGVYQQTERWTGARQVEAALRSMAGR